MDARAQQQGLENLTSAADIAGMLQQIYGGQLISGPASGEMLRILRARGQRTDDPNLDYLGRDLMPRPVVAQVNGLLDVLDDRGTVTGVRNDAAVIEKDGRAYVLVILLQAPGRESAAVAAGAIARASKEILAAVSDLDGGPPR